VFNAIVTPKLNISTKNVFIYQKLPPLKTFRFLLLVVLLFSANFSIAQTLRGRIITPASPTTNPMDPNGDRFVTKTTTGFSNDGDYIGEFELPMFGIPKVANGEVDGDNVGNPCGITDLIPDKNGFSVYAFRDANNNLICRFRVGDNNPSVEAWTLLLDVDGLFGPGKDPNATADNPGFELDITLIKRNNAGILVYNIDGTDKCGSSIANYSIATNFQISLADEVSCGDPDYFYDFYVPFPAVAAAFNASSGSNISASTGLRYVAVTNTSATCAMDGKIADISGVDNDDPLYNNCDVCAFTAIIESQCPTAINDLCSTCLGFNSSLPAKPTINEPIRAGQTIITGTSGAGTFLLLSVYQRIGGTDAAPIWSTTPREEKVVSVPVSAWSVTLSSPMLAYDKIVAKSQLTIDGSGCDSSNGNTTSTSVTVVEPNVAPVAQNQAVSVIEDTPKTITVGATDADGNPLTYVVVTQPTNGTLTGTAPNLIYTPNLNYNGPDSFTFRASDGVLNSNTATVTITVTPVNDVPIANNQSVTTPEDTPKLITLTASDIENNTLTYSIVSSPTHGTLSGSGATITYTPAANYFGSDTFTFKANDGSDSNIATVTITVTPVNDPPVASNVSVTTPEDVSVIVPLAGTDIENNTLVYTIVTPPSFGTLSGGGGNPTYIPNANYNGPDSFSYKVNDGTADSNIATVTITVTPVNDAPTAISQTITTPEDTPVGITLTATHPDAGAIVTFSIVTPPQFGTLTGALPNLTYTPNANFNGQDRFTFKANDGVDDSNIATVIINVTPVSDSPIASNLTVTTNEDTPVSFTIVGTDPDGSAVTYTILSQPANGTLTGTAPNLTYTPNANFNGSNSFTFKVNDGTSDSNTATVTITVTPVNDAPVANNQSVITLEDTPVAITLTGSDIDGNALTYTVITSPQFGTLSGTAPNLTYTPNANYAGPDSFTFRVNDGTVNSNVATVSITVTSVNDAPLASNINVTTNEDTPVSITLVGTDQEGNSITYILVSSPANGVLTGTGANRTYSPNANYNGADSFTYKVNDGTTDSNTATVSITVNPVNDVPIANNQTVAAVEEVPKSITLTGSDIDGDPLTYTVVTLPQFGILTGTGANLTYTSNDFTGAAITDSFTFRVNDGTTNSNIATVFINISPDNDAPQAFNRLLIINEDTPVSFTLVGSDPQGDPITYSIVSGPTKGTLSGPLPGLLTYTPNANYNGSDSFTFKVNDGVFDSNIATVTIQIDPVNDAPIANNQSVTVVEDTPKAITLTATDVENDPLTYTIVAQPLHGVLSGTGANITYTPNADYVGSDSFTFRANDGTLNSNTATVSINVSPANDAPVAANQSISTNEDQAVSFTISGTDPDGDPITYTIVSNPSNGTLTGTAPNLTYTPNPNFSGSDAFTFKVNDGTTDSNIATVTITVIPLNDAPVAISNTILYQANTLVNFVLTAFDADGDPLTYTVLTLPTNGVMGGTAPNLTYTPNTGFTGSDALTFKVNDGTVDSNIATITFNFDDLSNDAPVAENQSVTVIEDTNKNITLGASDPDGNALVYTIVSNPTNGILTGTGANITYSPNANYTGPDSFTFRVNDGLINSNTATVSITVTPVNDAPIANNQSVSVQEDIAKAILLTGSDVDGNPITFTLVTSPSHGTLTGTIPNLTYTPSANYNGSDSFTFKVNDGTVDSNIATVSITVVPVNDDAPVATNQTVTTGEDTPVVVILTATDPDGDALTFAVVTAPLHGTLSCNNCANPTYTPSLNYNGPDSFTFRANDGTNNSNVATVSITVNPFNDAPQSDNQSVLVQEDTPKAITLTASDVDGDPLTFSVVTQPTHGTLSGAAPNLVYTPNANYTGPDSFTFRANDGSTNSGSKTVTITVVPVNDAPIANNQNINTLEDTPLLINLSVTDPDGATPVYTVVSLPTHGTLSCTNCANPTYTPALNYTGPDSFTFKANDGVVDSNVGTITITVNPVNDNPVADNQTVIVTEDQAKAFTLTGSDAESAIVFTVLSQPTHGVLSGTAPNLTYTPDLNYTGSDSFTFKVNDGTTDSNTGTISITVVPVNDAPTVADQTITTNEDIPVAISLTGSDIDLDALTYSIVTPPAHGTLSGTLPNATYTPDANYYGPDSFTFKANDGTVDSNIATVTITVTPVNDAPVADNQSVTVVEDIAKAIVLTGSDVEGDALTFSILTQPTQGILSGSGVTITYTPNANYNGPDSFTFIVNDGTTDSNVATVSINVSPINDAPVANNDAITTSEDLPVAFAITGNDVDIDGTINAATVDLDPSTPAEDKTFTVAGQGTYVVDNSGIVIFTPALNYNGTATPVSYSVKDNEGMLTNVASIQVIVTPVNDAPVVTPLTVTVNEDETSSVCFAVTDVENDPSVFTGAVSLNGNGTLVLDPATGLFCFLYTPNPNYNGQDVVEVTVCDANNPTLCSIGVITINIAPVNDPPIILVGGNPVDSVFASTPEDTPVNFCFDATDLEGDVISIGTITNTSGGGTLVNNSSTGNTFCFSFTPTSNFSGSSFWKVHVCDSGNPSLCREVTIEIEVIPIQDPPVAINQNVTVIEDTPKVIVLGATDPDASDVLTYTINSGPTKGTLAGTGANVTYTPDQNYYGPDSFTFKVNDGTDDSNVATVTIDVTPVNDAPVISPIPVLTVAEDGMIEICVGVTDIDGDGITYNLPTNVSGGGTMTLSTQFNFCFVFKPIKDFNGDSFWKFSVCDTGNPSLCTSVDVKIIVTPVNDAPVAVNDFITVQSFVKSDPINILDNDLDVENDQLVLTITPLAGPYHGTVTMTADGNIQYQSNLGFIGADSIRYKVCDLATPSLCDEGVVFIDVTPAPFKIYNGLSPNGDFLNDYWRIDGIEAFPNNKVRVFDRYNNLIFETTGYNNSDNTWQGQTNHSLVKGNVSEGTYFYVVDLGDGSGLYSGYVVLKKD